MRRGRMDIMTFTTHAWLLPPFSADMQTMKNPRNFPSFLARQPPYTPPTPARRASCSFRCHARFFTLSSILTLSDNDRKLGDIGPCPHSRNKNFATLSSIWFCGSLFFLSLFPFCINTKNDWRRGRGVACSGVFWRSNISYYHS